MASKKNGIEENTPRPKCSGCGGGATHEVNLSTCELVVDREAGPNSKRYWTGSYKYRTNITTLLCGDCMKSSVRVGFNVQASIDHGKQAP